MTLSLGLYLIALLGFIMNRQNIIQMLLCIEMMLLALTLLILTASIGFNDIMGNVLGIYIISIAGAESAIGLAVIVAFYRLRGSIAINLPSVGDSKQTTNQDLRSKFSISPRGIITLCSDSIRSATPANPGSRGILPYTLPELLPKG